MTRRLAWTFFLCFVLCPLPLAASDWSSWRGPRQTGVALDTNLPAKFSLDATEKDNNLIWKAPFGCRSTPLVLNDRVYVINYTAQKFNQGGKVKDVAETIQERVMCLDANTGKPIWEHAFPIFHTDIVTVRLGWTNLAADPATGNIYSHSTSGLFFCLDGKKGKVLWSKSMSEEFGRITGYGGRVTSPIVDEDLVILGMVNSSWGAMAKGANRFIAMNKTDGKVVWISEPAAKVRETYYSSPVVATINGQRLLISGGADGSVFAMKVRTGEPVWRYNFGTGAINASPVVDGNLVYIGHGEETPDNNIQGRFICVDASQVKKGEPKLVWKVDGLKARYSSPIVHEGRVYVVDEGSKLFCLDAKTGEEHWKIAYGRGDARASPVLADGKIYVGEVASRFHILQPGPKKCKKLHSEFIPSTDGSDIELNGCAAVANGRVYFSTSEEIICIGTKEGKGGEMPIEVRPLEPLGKITHLQIVPAEIALHSGESVTFKVRAFDVNGNFGGEVKAKWTLPAPPPPVGVKANPPALKGVISDEGKLTADAKIPSQQSIVVATFDGVTGRARVRVAPKIPYFQNFEKLSDGAAPGGWINTQGKFLVKTVEGKKVLAKVNDKGSPLFARGNAYITLPTAKDYIIECDVRGAKVGSDMPDMGVVNNRYRLMLAGNLQKLRIVSWDALPRIDKTVQFDWKPDVWYRLKLTVDIHGNNGIVRGKAWPRDQKEPADWTIEVTDSRPVTEGSAALYGYVTGILEDRPGTEIYYDNVRITPNKGGKGALDKRLGR